MTSFKLLRNICKCRMYSRSICFNEVIVLQLRTTGRSICVTSGQVKLEIYPPPPQDLKWKQQKEISDVMLLGPQSNFSLKTTLLWIASYSTFSKVCSGMNQSHVLLRTTHPLSRKHHNLYSFTIEWMDVTSMFSSEVMSHCCLMAIQHVLLCRGIL